MYMVRFQYTYYDFGKSISISIDILRFFLPENNDVYGTNQ